jgi:5-methylcytosine-specific restriction endonuclease McrBC regulatory subunit McrC
LLTANKLEIQIPENKTYSSDDPNYHKNDTIEVSKLIGKSLKTPEDQLLAASLTNRGILTIKQLKSGLEVTTTSHIGVIEFSDFTLKILPKYSITPTNLPKLIGYAWNLIDVKYVENQINFEKEDDLLIDIIVAFFIKHCDILLKHGLFKSYEVHEESIPFLRGKLLLKQQITNEIKNNAKFACQFDELEYDNIENRILNFALKCSYFITNNEILKQNIQRLIHQFQGFVTDVYISTASFDKIFYNRFNNHYQIPIELARLIIDSSGIGDYFKPNRYKTYSFFVDMNVIFEKFVERLFTEYYSNLKRFIVKPQKSQKAWTSDLDDTKRIRTDILVYDDQTNQKYVIDTKYKEKLSDTDRYQIGFYIHEHMIKEQRQGFAILPKYPESQNDVFRSEIQRISINVKHIDLNNLVNLAYDTANKNKFFEEIDKIVPISVVG